MDILRRAAQRQPQAFPGRQVETVDVDIVDVLVAVADRAGDMDLVVGQQAGIGGERQRVAGVGGRRDVGIGGDRRACPQAGAAAERGGGDDAGADAGWNRQHDDLLGEAVAVVAGVEDGLDAEDADAAAVDGDLDLRADQAGAFEHQRVAFADRSAERAQHRHDLQPQGGRGAQHLDEAAARQRRDLERQRAAVVAGDAGAGDRAGGPGIVDALELHQRRAGEALAGQRDGLAGIGRGDVPVGRRAGLRRRRDAGELHRRLGREHGPRERRRPAFRDDGDRPVERQGRGQAVAQVLAVGHVEVPLHGQSVAQGDAADRDGRGAFLEARPDELERAVAARPAGQAGQRRHHLQPHAGAGVVGLNAGGAVIAECLVKQHGPVGAHLEAVRAVAGGQPVPTVDRIEVEGQRVGLAGGKARQRQRLALIGEAAREARQSAARAALDAGVAPLRLGAGLEVVGEHARPVLADGDVVDAPALVVDAGQPEVAEAQPRRVGSGREGHRHLAVDAVGIAAVEGDVAGAGIDHADVAGRGQDGHGHLQARAVGADGERGERHGRDGAVAVADLELHLRAGAEAAAGQFDRLAGIGRGHARLRRRAVARQRRDARQRRARRRRLEGRIDLVDLSLC